MRFARLPSNLAPNQLSLAVAGARQRGVTLIDLTEANPTRVGFDYPADLLAPLSDSGGLSYDPQAMGLVAARSAVAADFARRGRHVPAAQVALTASTSEAYALIFKLLCDPGDAVLVPRPSYPLFEHLTRLESVRAVPYDLEYHGAWRIDLHSLTHALDARARVLLVVSPNNPTGSFLHADDLAAITRVCRERQLALVGDEVFADYPLDAAPKATSVLAQQDVLTFSLGGLSKSAGLPQVKLGWMALAGPSDEVTETLAAYEMVADTYLSVSTPVQMAAPALIEGGVQIRGQIQARTRRNLEMLRRACAAYPATAVLKTEGGWSAVIKVPAIGSEEDLVLDLVTNHNVLVHPGYFFDFSSEAYLVVSLIVEPATFDLGVATMLARTAGSCS